MRHSLLTAVFTVLSFEIAAIGDNFTVATDFQAVVKGFVSSSKPISDLCHAQSSIAVDVHVPVPSIPNTSSPISEVPNSPEASGNCTSNLTASTITNPIVSDEAPPPTPTEAQPDREEVKQPIATFDEWTKEKLKQEQRKVSVPPVVLSPGPSTVAVPSPTASSRNYASRECGAKILQSNPEAENAKSILSEKEKDEYMRNPCGKAENKFVVVELCETIQPRTIELGNFELFSSSPREVRIWASERFPASDWKLMSEFSAADTRLLQSFAVSSSLYAKFIKVELVSHYGSEHYCTLTVLKVLGLSMVDEYEIEAEAAVRIPPQVIPEAVIEASAQPSNTVESPTSSPSLDTKEPEVFTPITEEAPNSEGESDTVESQILPPSLDRHSAPVTSGIVDEVVSGRMLKKVINAVSDQFGGKTKSVHKRFRSFDMSLCRVCPIERTCIVPTHLCWVFVWRPPPKSKNPSPPAVFLRQHVPQHLRRRRLAFLERQELNRQMKVVQQESIVATTTASPSATSEESVPLQPRPPMTNSAAQAPTATVNPTVSSPVSEVPESIPAPSLSHKESVFMKLNKRIAALELNMSLSTEYLSELSRQYVAQADLHKKHLEEARRAAQEASDVESRLNTTLLSKLDMMRSEIDTLISWFSTIQRMTTELSFRRYSRAYQKAENSKESCEAEHGEEEEDTTDLKHYTGATLHEDTDGLWTTEQVAYAVIGGQLSTLLLVALLSGYSFYRNSGAKSSPVISEEELEELVQKKVEDALRGMAISTHLVAESVQELPNPTVAPFVEGKRRRRHKRRSNSHQIAENEQRDTTAPATSQTETSSEAESSQHTIVEEIVRQSTPPPPSPPWIEVSRR